MNNRYVVSKFYVRRHVVDDEAFPDVVSHCNIRTIDGSDLAPI